MWHVIINGEHKETIPASGTSFEHQHALIEDNPGSFVRVIEYCTKDAPQRKRNFDVEDE